MRRLPLRLAYPVPEFVVYYGQEILLFHGKTREEAFAHAPPGHRDKVKIASNLRWAGYLNGYTYQDN